MITSVGTPFRCLNDIEGNLPIRGSNVKDVENKLGITPERTLQLQYPLRKSKTGVHVKHARAVSDLD
jgi:hypothetical protein